MKKRRSPERTQVHSQHKRYRHDVIFNCCTSPLASASQDLVQFTFFFLSAQTECMDSCLSDVSEETMDSCLDARTHACHTQKCPTNNFNTIQTYTQSMQSSTVPCLYLNVRTCAWQQTPAARLADSNDPCALALLPSRHYVRIYTPCSTASAYAQLITVTWTQAGKLLAIAR